MDQVNHEDIQVSKNTHITRVQNCKNNTDIRSDGYELVSLSGEYAKHLLSVVLNKVNQIHISDSSFLSIINKIISINFYSYFYEPFYLLDGFINLICNFCDCTSVVKCTCDCKCEPKCTGNTICLCLCNSKVTPTNGCCICICKHKDNPKCICICICKNGEQGCASGGHTCEKCLVKVDIGTLKDQTYKILCDLRWIKSCLGRNGTTKYSSIISSIHRIELLFKQIGTKMTELSKLYKALSEISLIAKACERCCSPQTQQSSNGSSLQLVLGFIVAVAIIAYNKWTGSETQPSPNCSTKETCKEKIDRLIKNIESALHYYSLFGSRIEDIRSYVYYKIFYPKLKQILIMFPLSIKPLRKQLEEINSDIIKAPNRNLSTNNTSVVQINNLLMVVYSHNSVFQYLLAMYILLQSSSKLYSILYVIKRLDYCECIKEFKSKQWDRSIFSKTKSAHANHVCLCMVMKYVLNPSLVKSMYYLRYVYLDALGKQNRDFTRNKYGGMNINYMTKMLFLTINLLYKISIFMKSKFFYFNYCMYNQNPYYSYLISTILFVSSMIENIWSMDTETVRRATEKISSLLAEYQSLHVYTNYYSPSPYNILRVIRGLTKPNSIHSIVSSSGLSVGARGKKQSLVTSKSRSTATLAQSNESSSTASIISSVTSGATAILNDSTKFAFKSLTRMMLGIHFSKDKLTLICGKYSDMWFYYKNSTVIKTATIKTMRNLAITISLKYLQKMCEKPCTCPQKNGCQMCIAAKMFYFGLTIVVKMVRYSLASIIKHTLVGRFKLESNVKMEFVRNSCLNCNLEILRMTKNNLLTSSSYGTSFNSNITDVSSVRNWGYDILYEQDITNNPDSFSVGYPILINSSENKVGTTRKIFQMLHIKLNTQQNKSKFPNFVNYNQIYFISLISISVVRQITSTTSGSHVYPSLNENVLVPTSRSTNTETQFDI